MPRSGPIVGIDLGTSSSNAAVWCRGSVRMVESGTESPSVPSVVAYLADGQTLVGSAALNQRALNPRRTIEGAKRFIGRRFESAAEVDRAYPFPLMRTDQGGIGIIVGDRVVLPEQVAAEVLALLKRRTEEMLGQPVERAVITVPVYFDVAQRAATVRACEIAGLKVERVINESTAAALAYGVDSKRNAKVAVFDLGGGTFNVSILDLGDGVFEVLSTGGDPQAGGEEITEAFAQYLAEGFLHATGADVRADPIAMQRLRQAADVAKVGLSSISEVLVHVPGIILSGGAVLDLRMPVTRAAFERACAPCIERLVAPCERAMADAGIGPADIAHVVMVGGSTRIPKVQALAKRIFGRDALDKRVNPDEVVAIGAAIQGAVLQGDVHGIVLLDVTPLSLGVETLGGVMTRLIERNSTIPISRKEVFSTAVDNQNAVTIVVLQGDHPMAADNRTLGRFDLTGIASALSGVPQIEIEFELDANGVLSVRATDKATGKTQGLRLVESQDIPENSSLPVHPLVAFEMPE